MLDMAACFGDLCWCMPAYATSVQVIFDGAAAQLGISSSPHSDSVSFNSTTKFNHECNHFLISDIAQLLVGVAYPLIYLPVFLPNRTFLHAAQR